MADEDVKQDAAAADQDATTTTTLVDTKPAPPKPAPPKRKPKKLPPYKVLLHNDDTNTFEHVITSVVRLTSLTTQEALLRALEAHESGLALLLVTHRERAELYADQFQSLSITVTIEPAEG